MKISELGSAGALSGTEVLPIVQSGTTKKVSIDDVVAFGGGSQNLQQVTNVGNTTTNEIIIQDGDVRTHYKKNSIYRENTSTGDDFSINFPSLNNQNYTFPNQGGYIPVTVNGNQADANGNIIVSTGTSNPTSTYIPVNNSGSFIDSYLLSDNANGILKSVNSGINLDFQNFAYSLGDYDKTYNGTSILVDVNSERFDTWHNGWQVGVNLDFNSKSYYFGDIYYSYQNTSFKIDDFNAFIETRCYGKSVGMYLDFNADQYKFGNFNSYNLYIDASNASVYFANITSWIGLNFDFGSRIYMIGDTITGNNVLNINAGAGDTTFLNTNTFKIVSFNSGLICDATQGTSLLGDNQNMANGTLFGINDTLETLFGSSNLLTTHSGSNSGYHLKINIGGNDYVIQLINAN